MTILVISDIHANLEALKAVLSSAEAVQATWCLGDLVGYGPDPNECIELIRDRPNLVCLKGNHDAAASGEMPLNNFNDDAYASIKWTKENLSDENAQFLSSLKPSQVTADVTLAHGSPRFPLWEYILGTGSASINFQGFSTQICMVGHTHIPMVFSKIGYKEVSGLYLDGKQTFKMNSRCIINPGSVGQPRDHNPRASYAIFNPEASTWNQFRVPYDIASEKKRILDAGLPGWNAARLEDGR